MPIFGKPVKRLQNGDTLRLIGGVPIIGGTELLPVIEDIEDRSECPAAVVSILTASSKVDFPQLFFPGMRLTLPSELIFRLVKALNPRTSR